MARWLIGIGVTLVIAGLIWPWIQKLGLGRLPGDIVIERENARIYIPIATSIVVNVALFVKSAAIGRSHKPGVKPCQDAIRRSNCACVMPR